MDIVIRKRPIFDFFDKMVQAVLSLKHYLSIFENC